MPTIFMIVLMVGISADTGNTVSKAKVYSSFSTMEECMSERKDFLTLASVVLREKNWIAGGGKVRVKHFNVVCSEFTETAT